MLEQLTSRVWAGIVAMKSRGLLQVIVSNLVQQAVAFLTVLLIARLLSPSDFAQVRIALAYVSVATVIASGGLTAPILRYCADNRYDVDERRMLLGIGLKRLVWISFATVLFLLVLVLIRNRYSGDAFILGVYALQLPGLAVSTLLLVYLQAIQQFRILALFQVIIRTVALLVTVAATYVYGLMGFLGASLLMAYLTCLPFWFASRPTFPSKKPFNIIIPHDFKRLAVYSVFGTLVTSIGQYSDLMILDVAGVKKGDVAAYSLATIFFFALMAFGGAVQGVATPAFTALIDQPKEFKRQLIRWTAMLSAASLPAAFFSVALAFAVEHLFLGTKYAGLGLILIVLMIKLCLWSTYAVGGAALVGIGAIRQGSWIAVVTTTVAVVVGYPMCLQFGIFGAAWTQVILAAISAGCVWWVIVIEIRALQERVLTSGKALN